MAVRDARPDAAPSRPDVEVVTAPRRRPALAVLAFAGLLAVEIAPHFLGAYAREILYRFVVGAVLAEAWNVLAGDAGLVSLGTSSAVGLGAYVAVGAMNSSGISIALAIGVAAAAGAALATVASPGLLRLRGLYFTVGTLALAEMLRLIMINADRFGGATGLFLDRDSPRVATLVRIAGALLGIAWGLIYVSGATRLSVSLRAVRDDEDAAAQIGIRAVRLKFLVFVVASALMAAVGALQALKLEAVEPYGMFGLGWSIDTLAMVIIGGLGQRLGAVIGAAVMVLSGEWLANYPQIHLALTGALLIAMTRFAPRGLAGLASDAGAGARRAWRRRARSGNP